MLIKTLGWAALWVCLIGTVVSCAQADPDMAIDASIVRVDEPDQARP